MTPEQQQDYYEQNPNARWLALVSVSLSIFIVILTISATNIAIPTIARDLHADAVATSWIPTALIWGTIVLLLPVGRFSDIYGRKKVYVTGIVSFSLVSLLIFLVRDVQSLLIIRVLQGFCSAMINGTGLAIIGSIFTKSNRGTALGISSSSVYLALSCGPVIGGIITQYIGWRGIFWVPVPVMLISLSLVFFYLKGEWKSPNPKPLDWVGSIIFALFVSVFFAGISGFPEPEYIGLMVLGVLILVLFFKQQARAEHPLIRIHLLRQNRVFSHSIVASFLMYSANFSTVFLISLYLQYIHDLTPLAAGKMVLIQTVIMMILSPISGRLSDKYEPRVIATLGSVIFSFGFLLLFWVQMDSSLMLVFIGLSILGLGFGLFSSPNNNATIGSASKDTLSIASVLLTMSRTLGNMTGTVMVMMLMTFAIGNVAIEPTNYPQLLWVVKLAFGLSFLITMLAAYFSYNRGKVH